VKEHPHRFEGLIAQILLPLLTKTNPLREFSPARRNSGSNICKRCWFKSTLCTVEYAKLRFNLDDDEISSIVALPVVNQKALRLIQGEGKVKGKGKGKGKGRGKDKVRTEHEEGSAP
jgi:hypothetical protein